MSATILEWLNLLARWIHVIAAIMWVGDSFLFMWMDRHLSAPTRTRDGAVVGELWMVHSGGFYEVVKRKSLAKNELPPNLYWFKWESYTTWLSGLLLLAVVYYFSGGVFLVDGASRFGVGTAVGLSLGLLVAGFLVYDTLWRTLGQKNATAAKLVSWALLVGLVVLVTRLFPGRAAFLQVGATIGTLMAANVFFRIIPAQRYMLAQTNAGEPVDTTLGLRAKQRSTHNHYLTLPVLITMLSNHFPGTYAHPLNWLVLLLLFVVGASLKYFMNFRFSANPFVPMAGGVALMALVGLSLGALQVGGGPDFAGAAPVPFARAQAIITTRCLSCHAAKPANPSFPQPPNGIVLEDPARIRALSDRILARAVITKTMPLANLTGMLDDERLVLGAWIFQGAKLDGAVAPVVKAALAPPPASPAAQSPADEAKAVFSSRCVACHGASGKGDGVAAVALVPRPRDYTDHAWQAGVTDDLIRKVIVEGGPAVGKSPLMPANPDLADKKAVADELLKLVRGFDARP